MRILISQIHIYIYIYIYKHIKLVTAVTTKADLNISNFHIINWRHRMVNLFISYTGWPKSHFTLLKAKKTKPNKAKKMGYISNERPDQGVFLGI